MKKIFILLFVVVFCLCLAARSQERYAYLPGGKATFQTSAEKIIVKYKSGTAVEHLRNFVSPGDLANPPLNRKWEIITLKESYQRPDSMLAVLDRAYADRDILYASPLLIYKDGMLQGLTDQVMVRLKPSANINDLSATFKNLGVKTVEENAYIDREYLLTIIPTRTRDALDVANALYESGLFEFSEPDFVKLNALASDPDLPNQWGLQNTGQYSGTPGADIKAVKAWGLSTGTGIKVAVVDEGVDLVHQDLQANLLPGVDELGQGTNGAPVGDDAHGTAVAGIIAAIANNGYGVEGVAYNSKIIPVRAGEDGSIDNADAAVGINWAASATGGNADVINCSWGGGAPSADVNTAIATALSNGRGGKGCVILVSSGDSGVSTMEWPAQQPGVVAVGASNMCDQRVVISSGAQPGNCNYDTRQAVFSLPSGIGSSYGTGLGVVAPGINIATTDISGQPGYSNQPTQGWITFDGNTNYIQNFDGTSAATAFASGVAALILAANPCLNYTQATAILESTADKVGGYSYSTNLTNGTWNNQMGYGRIDAYAALVATVQYPISGPTAVCTSATYTLSSLPAGSTVSWSLSSAIGPTLSLSNETNTSVLVTNNNYYTTSGTLSASITIPGSCSIITSNFPVIAAGRSITATGLINQGLCFNDEQLNNVSMTIGPPNFIYDYCPATVSTTPSFGNSPQFSVLSGTPSAFAVDGEIFELTLNGGPVSIGMYQYSGGGCPVTTILFMPYSDSQGSIASPDSLHGSGAVYQLAPSPAAALVTISRRDLRQPDATANPAYQVAVGGGPAGSSIRQVRVFDVAGRLRKGYQFGGLSSSVQIDVSGLNTGLYFVEIFDGQVVELKKLMVQH